MNLVSFGIHLLRISILLSILAPIATAGEQPRVRATVQPAKQRKSAPEFSLQDCTGKTINLKNYHGKVLLLDFWATWCHGCKEEIPWFAEFKRKYAARGLTVVGVSLDDDGWTKVKPFMRDAKIPYQILLGNEATAKRYGIERMPDTFLIDRQGRIAATYVGLVDKEDVEKNIRAMLAPP